MKANNTIHINGKVYDARTGELLSKPTKKSVAAPKIATPKVAIPKKPVVVNTAKKGNGFIDGIKRNPNAPVATKKQVTKSAPVVKKSSVTRAVAPAHRAPKHSATLNRTGVKTPKIAAPATAVSKQAQKKSVTSPMARVERAKNTVRSSAISRFGSISPQTTKIQTTEPQAASLSMKHIAKAAEKAKATRKMEHVKNQLIAESLSVANTATKQKKVRNVKRSPKIFHFAAPGLAALLLIGYVTYLNVPSLSLKVASSRAGFAATLPSKSPSGYSLQGPIAYSPGQVVLNFGSHTDGRRFSIVQQPTTWDSAALKENYVAKNSTVEPLTYQDSGLTIYLFNGGDAAWVNDGKFYSVKTSNSQLDTQQLLNIATSM